MAEKSYTEVGFVVNNCRVAVRFPTVQLKHSTRLFIRPKREKQANENAAAGNNNNWKLTISRRCQSLFRPRQRKTVKLAESSSSTTTSSSSSSLGSASSSMSANNQNSVPSAIEWLSDFRNPVMVTRRQNRNSFDCETDRPELTSTPVNLRIRPINQLYNHAALSPVVTTPDKTPLGSWQKSVNLDISGVKIYENPEGTVQLQAACDNLAVEEGECEEIYSINDITAETDEGGNHYENVPTLFSRSCLGNMNNSYEIVCVENHKVLATAHFKPRSLKFGRF